MEVSTAGRRKTTGEMYSAPAMLEMCLEVGAPIALSSDAHVPGDVGAGYEAAQERLEMFGVGDLCVFDPVMPTIESLG